MWPCKPAASANRHLRLTVRDSAGQPLEAVAFGAFDSPLGPALETRAPRFSTWRAGWS
jgi:hypothetical protein